MEETDMVHVCLTGWPGLHRVVPPSAWVEAAEWRLRDPLVATLLTSEVRRLGGTPPSCGQPNMLFIPTSLSTSNHDIFDIFALFANN